MMHVDLTLLHTNTLLISHFSTSHHPIASFHIPEEEVVLMGLKRLHDDDASGCQRKRVDNQQQLEPTGLDDDLVLLQVFTDIGMMS